MRRQCAVPPAAEGRRPPHRVPRACVQGLAFKDYPLFDRDAANETFTITTVAIYLQDHRTNAQGLSVKPRTHNDKERNLRVYRECKLQAEGGPSAPLHYGMGDAVVFDARLVHRGPRLADANHRGELDAPHRSMITLTFGRRNQFSRVVDRGFAMRSRYGAGA